MASIYSKFWDDGYAVARDFIETDKWFKICNSKKTLKEAILNDQQSGGTNAPSFYKVKKLNELHEIVRLKLEHLLNADLYKTYHYFRNYKYGSFLKPHRDREACEISVTLNLGGDDWQIGIFNYNSIPRQILLKKGDALLYHGTDLIHWRPGIFKGNNLTQIFLHYVQSGGPHAWAKDDLQLTPP